MRTSFRTAVLVAALAFPVGLAAQSGQQQQQQQKPQQQSGQVGTTGAVATATVNNIVDNPSEYYNQRVTVSGDVGDVYGAQLFNIEEKGVLDVDDELLVLLPKAQQQQKVTEDSKVQVTGTVRPFVRADIEREYNISDWGVFGIDDQEDFFKTYDRKPVLIADAIDVRQQEKEK